jgi:hypothetical protein
MLISSLCSHDGGLTEVGASAFLAQQVLPKAALHTSSGGSR